jgi:exodeoxyribonuclease VII large subunit
MSSTPATHNQPEYSVSELSFSLKKSVEDQFPFVRVRGEISGLKAAASGHVYLKLKDDNAVLDAVCWKGVAVRFPFQPEDGMEVVCTGKITTYPQRSNYQLVIESMEPAGEGALMALLEKRKQLLAKEGLFAVERKKPLPKFPEVIGVITSPTGAVIEDILHRLEERYPCRVLLFPVLVQGEKAAEQIAAAIVAANRHSVRPDVLIVARGGGSLEDLWAFNEEIVVRAAAASEIPLISAVGHETDTTLIDYAADVRAPTPTAAAEIATPVRAQLLEWLGSSGLRLTSQLQRQLSFKQQYLQGLIRGLPHPKELVEYRAQRLDMVIERLARGLPVLLERKEQRLLRALSRLPRMERMVADKARHFALLAQRLQPQIIARQLLRRQEAIAGLGRLLESFHYKKILKRGFVLVRDHKNKPVLSGGATHKGQWLTLEFYDGTAQAVIAEGERRKPEKTAQSMQGDLF